MLAEGLGARERDVVAARFGLDGRPPRNLAQIGAAYGLTRERIRQIERAALYKLRMPHRARKLAPHADLPAAPRRRAPAAPGPPAAMSRAAPAAMSVKSKGDCLVAADDAGRARRPSKSRPRAAALVVSWEDEPLTAERSRSPPRSACRWVSRKDQETCARQVFF